MNNDVLRLLNGGKKELTKAAQLLRQPAPLKRLGWAGAPTTGIVWKQGGQVVGATIWNKATKKSKHLTAIEYTTNFESLDWVIFQLPDTRGTNLLNDPIE